MDYTKPACRPVHQKRRVSRTYLPSWLGPGLSWIIGCAALTILAHTGDIAGWVMHLGTVILTFRFALRLGSCLR